VGKSNVLEALGLFSVPYLEIDENLNKFIRVENRNELFYNTALNYCGVETNLERIAFEIDDYGLRIHRYLDSELKGYDFSKKLKLLAQISSLTPSEKFPKSNILRYIFNPQQQWKSTGDKYLLPPFGENIIDVLSYNSNIKEVKSWIKKELEIYKLELVLDKTDSKLKVQKRLNEDEVYSLPYSSIADTLQRIIFYKTAIASNKNSVLLFEEPEAHAFPPYIKTMTQDIIDTKTNQFFIVTHSPFVINDFIEYADLRKEVSIYLFDFKNDQTTVKRLTDEEVNEVYEYGIDLFFNIESFLQDE
jgi:AAA15 family ATPase/GTPase